ncbi:MAG: hypothetical protein K2K05_05305 [Muribaculaceae bacterium]|nr:hypothetical protein [Muribaculaceae bacterium]
MKKKILSIAILALSLVSFSGVAQSQNNTTETQRTEKVKGSRADKKDQRERKNPYEGLNLTDVQKARLQQLDENRKAQREQMKQQRKDRQSQDKAANMEARRASKKSYLDEVKAIIGPDQYVVFLENMYMNGGDKQGIAHNKGGKGDRQQKDRGNRADRQHTRPANS